MKRKFLIAFLIVITITANVFAQTNTDTVFNDTQKYIYGITQNPEISSVGGEWAVLGLARGNANIPDSYYEKYYENVKSYVKNCNGVLHEKKYTEYARVILALTAIGADPKNVDGYNLLLPLGDFEKTVWQGINGSIWALIALDSANYEVLENADANIQATRDMYVQNILASQGTDGGWSLAGTGESDVDVTAMALCALSNYQSDSLVKTSIDKALDFLCEVQNENGGFSSRGNENSESVSQVIVAFCVLGISINDSRFVKNEKTVLDNLMTFYNENGSFNNIYDGSGVNQMATEQAFCALAALKRYNENKTSFYDMRDAEKKIMDAALKNQFGLPNKNADVLKREIISDKTFSDIKNHSSKLQIEALASRNIINGKTENTFEPDFTMTRAEFATIVAKSLGLPLEGIKKFDDVSENDWFYSFVSSAYKYGIITGVTDTSFNPNGIITKEEAAVMISRASKLCGIDNKYEEFAIRDILSEFTDYIKASKWSQEALAFCYDNDILSSEEMEINPQVPVTRAEIAVMLYNMLKCAKLL